MSPLNERGQEIPQQKRLFSYYYVRRGFDGVQIRGHNSLLKERRHLFACLPPSILAAAATAIGVGRTDVRWLRGINRVCKLGKK